MLSSCSLPRAVGDVSNGGKRIISVAVVKEKHGLRKKSLHVLQCFLQNTQHTHAIEDMFQKDELCYFTADMPRKEGFAAHEDHLRKLRERINARGAWRKNTEATSPEYSQQSQEVSHGRKLRSTHSAHSTSPMNTSPPAQQLQRRVSSKPRVPEAEHRIADLKRDLSEAIDLLEEKDKQLISKDEELGCIEEEIKDVVRKAEREVDKLSQKLSEVREEAKTAMKVRESHHEKEKEEMLIIFNKLQDELEAATNNSHMTSNALEIKREQLRESRWKYSLEGNEELESLVRRLEYQELQLNEANNNIRDEKHHSEVLSHKLQQTETKLMSVSEEFSLLKEEHHLAMKSHASIVHSLQAASLTSRGDVKAEAQKSAKLKKHIKEYTQREGKLQITIKELTDEVAFASSAKEYSDKAVHLMKSEVQSLQGIILKMEEQYHEVESKKLRLQSAEAEVEEARVQTNIAAAAEAEMKRRLESSIIENKEIISENREILSSLEDSSKKVDELLPLSAELRSAKTEIFRRFPSTGELSQYREIPLKEFISIASTAIKEKESLLSALEELKAEHIAISASLSDFTHVTTESKGEVESIKAELAKEREAHDMLKHDVANTQSMISEYEKKVHQLGVMATEDRKQRELCEASLEKSTISCHKLKLELKETSERCEAKIHDLEVSRKLALSKAGSMREEERQSFQNALFDLKATRERNRLQSGVIEKLESDLTRLRRLVVDTIQESSLQEANYIKLQEMVDNLKSTNATYDSDLERELKGLQSQYLQAINENRDLRIAASKSSEKLTRLDQRQPTVDQHEYNRIQSVLEFYESNEKEVQKQIDILITQKQMADAELEASGGQIQSLRKQFAELRESRNSAQDENSSLTTQLCLARQQSQEQQRLLMDEINVLRMSLES